MYSVCDSDYQFNEGSEVELGCKCYAGIIFKYSSSK